MKKVRVSPAIDESIVKWYEENFKNINQGVTFALENFPGLYTPELKENFEHPLKGLLYIHDVFYVLYERTLATFKEKFSSGELCLMVDTYKKFILAPQLAGLHLDVKIVDGIAIDGLDKKWEVNKNKIIEKVAGLTLLEKICLEIWLRAFWEGRQKEQDDDTFTTDLEKHVEQLL